MDRRTSTISLTDAGLGRMKGRCLMVYLSAGSRVVHVPDAFVWMMIGAVIGILVFKLYRWLSC